MLNRDADMDYKILCYLKFWWLAQILEASRVIVVLQGSRDNVGIGK